MQFDVKDRLQLSKFAELDAGPPARIVDTALDAWHRLNPSATEIIALLAAGDGTRFGDLVKHLADRFNLAEDTAAADLEDLLNALDSMALLEVHRSSWRKLSPMVILDELVAKLLNPGYRAKAVRYPGTVRGVLTCILAFTRNTLILWAIFCGVAYLVIRSIPSSGSFAWQVDALVSIAVLPLILLWSIVTHELSHFLAMTAEGRKHVVVVRRGWKMALVHKEKNPSVLVRVAVAGPIAAFVLTSLLAFVALVSTYDSAQAFLVAPLVGATHLLSLLPRSADGRMLLGNLKLLRENGSAGRSHASSS